MESVNLSILVSLVMSILTLGAYVYVTRRQIIEVLLPKDWLTNLRIIILTILITSIIGIVPVIVFNVCRLYGLESQTLRDVASVAGNISRLATAILLVFVYEYRKGE